MAFVERSEKVVHLDSSGVGKSHLAINLGRKAASQGIKTRFIAAADLMLQRVITSKYECLDQCLKRSILTSRLSIIDEIGYLPFVRKKPACSSMSSPNATSKAISSSPVTAHSLNGQTLSAVTKR